MKPKQLIADDDAVSPVIGVILMVSITVILAAVIGTFVLGLGEEVQQSSPTASFSMDFDTSDNTVTVTHEGGDTIKSEEVLKLSVSGATTGTWSGSGGSAISAGNSADYCPGSGTVNTGGQVSSCSYTWDSDTVRVVWESQNGDNSATLSEQESP
jgi:FlaG/FlaF family flagellin (archaellin)